MTKNNRNLWAFRAWSALVVLLAGVAALASSAEAAFPGASGKIVFASTRDGSSEIYVMGPAGATQTRLTTNSVEDQGPAWSPDATKIAFYSNRDGNGEIYVMNADGTAQTRLTSNPADDFNPAWSPDGTRIAFSSVRDGNYEIYVMNANGTGQARLTNVPGDDFNPSIALFRQRLGSAPGPSGVAP